MGNVPGQLGTCSEDPRAWSSAGILPGQGCFGCVQVTKTPQLLPWCVCVWRGVGSGKLAMEFGLPCFRLERLFLLKVCLSDRPVDVAGACSL